MANLSPELEKEVGRLMGGLLSKQCTTDDIRAAMLAALQAAEKECENVTGRHYTYDWQAAKNACAAAIRRLMG